MKEVYKQPESPLKQKFEALATKSDFNPREKRHYDRMVSEYLDILDNRTAEQMNQDGKVKELEAASAKIKEITDLVKNTPEIEFDLGKYGGDSFGAHDFQQIEGELFFVGTIDRKKVLVNQDEKIVYSGFVHVEDLQKDDEGKLFFSMKDENDVTSIVDETGKKIGTDNDFSYNLCRIGGKIFFIKAGEGSISVVVNEAGDEISNKYSNVRYLSGIGGKMVFLAKDGDEELVVVNGRELRGDYINATEPQEVAGEMFCSVQKKNKKWIIINEEGEEVSSEFDFIYLVADIGGEMHYIAVTEVPDDPEKNTSIVLNESGEEVSERYKAIRKLVEIRGKMHYVAKKDNGMDVVMNHLGEEVSDEYACIVDIKSIGDEFELRVHGTQEESNRANRTVLKTVNENREILNVGDIFIESPQYFVAGQFVLKGSSNDFNAVVVNRAGEELSKEFEQIIDIYEHDGKAYVLARNDGKLIKQRIYV